MGKLSQNHAVPPKYGVHNFTCSPSARYKRAHIGWYSIYIPRRDGRLSWPRCLITPGLGIEPMTARSEVRHLPLRHRDTKCTMVGKINDVFKSWILAVTLRSQIHMWKSSSSEMVSVAPCNSRTNIQGCLPGTIMISHCLGLHTGVCSGPTLIGSCHGRRSFQAVSVWEAWYRRQRHCSLKQNRRNCSEHSTDS